MGFLFGRLHFGFWIAKIHFPLAQGVYAEAVSIRGAGICEG
jgi:hypothetical protein